MSKIAETLSSAYCRGICIHWPDTLNPEITNRVLNLHTKIRAFPSGIVPTTAMIPVQVGPPDN